MPCFHLRPTGVLWVGELVAYKYKQDDSSVKVPPLSFSTFAREWTQSVSQAGSSRCRLAKLVLHITSAQARQYILGKVMRYRRTKAKELPPSY